MRFVTRGFSLVEALVALVVLSLGLLGAGALLLGGLRDQSRALRHGAAITLLADLGARIRANPAAGAAYDTRVEHTGPASCDAITPCNAADLAAVDVAHFAAAARALLAQRDYSADLFFEPATGISAPDRHVATLRWQDAHDPDARDDATLVVLAQPVAGAP